MNFQEYCLLASTIVYAILAVVFRWFVGVLISKVFFISLFGTSGEQMEGITFDGYLKDLFLESWSFYEVVWALVIASVLLAFLRGARSYWIQLVVVADSVKMRARLFEAMLDFERNSSGLQDTMMQKLEIVESYRLTSENERLMDIFIFVASVVLLIVFSWKSFLLVIALVGVQKVWIGVFDIPVLSQLRKEFQSQQSQVTSRMIDAARVRDLVQVHERQAAEANVVQELENEAAKINHKIAWRSFLMQLIPQCFNIATMPAVCLLSYELMKDLEGPKAISEGVSLLLVMFTLQELHRALCEVIVIEESKIVHDAALEDINKFLAARLPDAPDQERVSSASFQESTVSGGIVIMADGTEYPQLPLICGDSSRTSRSASAGGPSISLVNVGFQYREASKPALVNATATFEGGVVQAIMGESGGGKSTLLKILQGLLHPSQGQVLIDGQPLCSVLPAYRERLGVVSQDTLLFARTVRENLTYGLEADDPRVADECIERALRMACLEDVVATLDEGVDTMLAQGESQLSGGQRQRMHLARLFVRNPEVVLMDEPTSALDSATCGKVVRSLQTFLQGKTAIIVSHHREAVVDPLCHVVHHVEALSHFAASTPKLAQSPSGPAGFGKLARNVRGSFRRMETLPAAPPHKTHPLHRLPPAVPADADDSDAPLIHGTDTVGSFDAAGAAAPTALEPCDV